MKRETMQAYAFFMVAEMSLKYQKEIDSFRDLYLLQSCWLCIDSNGDVWIYTMKPSFHKQPNIGAWYMKSYSGKKARRAIRIARVIMPHPSVSEFSLTEVFK